MKALRVGMVIPDCGGKDNYRTSSKTCIRTFRFRDAEMFVRTERSACGLSPARNGRRVFPHVGTSARKGSIFVETAVAD